MSAGNRWQVDGSAAELYERVAERYILGPWAPGLIELAALRPGESVLDVACGTGVIARLAAGRVGAAGHVTGLDSSAGMIAVARGRDGVPGAAIHWVERSALNTGLADRSFDVALCQQGLQFFPDKLAALREMHRVLAPGGRLVLSVWRATGIYNAAVGDALREMVGEEAGRRFCASRDVPSHEELARLIAATPFSQTQLRVQRMTVRMPSLEDFVPAHLAGTPVATEIRAMGEGARVALGRGVAQRLSDYRDGGGVAFPEEVNVVTAIA
jgi:ubiquinone/menaquinone biosynthesis C-methylase UbiE